MSFFPLASIQSTHKLELLLSCINYKNSQHPKFGSQMLVTELFPPCDFLIHTPSLLPVPQKIWVCSDYLSKIRKTTSPLHPRARSQRLKKSESAQIIWEKATSPLHLWARSQFLLAKTPPFLAISLYRLGSQFLLNKLSWPSALTYLSRPSALTYLSRPSALTYLSRPLALTYLSRPSASTDFGFAEMRLRRFTILENSCFQLNLHSQNYQIKSQFPKLTCRDFLK